MKLTLTKSTSNCIKFLAALLVAMHHYSQNVVAAGSDNIFYFLCSTQGGYLGVAIFFFLSGFGLMESEQKHHLGLLQFLKKRILKVYMPVLIVTVLWMFVVLTIENKYVTSSNTLSSECLHLSWLLDRMYAYIESHPGFAITNYSDKVLWFVKVILQLYIVFFIFSSAWVKNRLFGNIILWIGIIATCFTASSIISIPFFGIGVYASEYKNKNYKVFNASLIPLLISAIIISCYCIVVTPEFKPSIILAGHALFNYIFIGLVIVCFTVKCIDIQFPALLGVISYDIYLVHNKILTSFTTLNINLESWLFITLSLAIAFVFYYFRKILTIAFNQLWKKLKVVTLKITANSNC